MHLTSAWTTLLASGLMILVACGGNVVIDGDPSAGFGGAGGTGAYTGVGAGAPATSGTGGVGAGSTGTSSGTAGGAGNVPDVVKNTCPDIAAEPLVCVTISVEGLAIVSPESGQHCKLQPLYDHLLGFVGSLGVIGNHVYWCDEDRVRRISLDHGVVDSSAPYACDAVTEWQGKLLVKPQATGNGDTLEVYATFEDISARAPEAVLPPVYNTRLATSATTLYSAWHATDEIARAKLPTMEPVASLFFSNNDDWVYGIWPNEDQGTLLVIRDEVDLITLDLASGAKVGGTELSYSLFPMGGLSCWRNP
ncbi:hypothetical protein [Chondromyces apiculatus]|uniref:Uncharacterized protein n=1 Tax=Chondromyces apiculatus DSM 436 TaxID=1192034 RepID=A0A017SSX1_9BACT|nr:hypothetical protein [Chondromyces apiculatus]EYF00078.1 Hypothetical protein CAP_1400 [Chondromyces apiculatus DSM 436]